MRGGKYWLRWARVLGRTLGVGLEVRKGVFFWLGNELEMRRRGDSKGVWRGCGCGFRGVGTDDGGEEFVSKQG